LQRIKTKQIMNATIQQIPVLNRDEVARLACLIWQSEGGQCGRDQEYWRRAERQIRAISQQGDYPECGVPVKIKFLSATVENTASQPVAASGSSASTRRKRASKNDMAR